jgi:threonine/homoserine/homoserine lactone efflux protein
MTDPVLFLVAAATLLAMPGPTNTLLAIAGGAADWRRALPLVGAALAGYLVAILAIRLLLAPVLHAVPALGIALKILVAAYLIWLAIKLWRQRLALAGELRPVRPGEIFLTTLLNPKALVFALAIIPQGDAGLGLYLAGFSLTALVTGGGWVALGALLGSAAGARARLVPRVGAVALVGFAGALLGSAV